MNMSFIDQLQKRNVMRVAILYSVTGWVLAQIIAFVAEAFGWSDWVLKVFTVGMALGFPVALIFSWSFEMTLEGVKRTAHVTPEDEAAKGKGRQIDYVIITMLAIALTISMYTGQWDAPRSSRAAVHAPSTAVTSVAVLPFLNMSADPANEFFSDGISEELVNVLVRVEGLRVPSRTSSFAYKGVEMDLSEIGAELRVDHILEGSVRRSGNTVRVTAQLIDIDTDTHLWSDSYDRELTDIFAIQDDIANNIVVALQEALGASATVVSTRSTDNLEAYELYLQARHLWRERRLASIRSAISLFKQALELDPDFAKAWSNLAAAYAVLPGYDIDSDVEADSMAAVEAAERALEIDPGLGEAYAVIGVVDNHRGDYVGMFEKSATALRLDPTDSTARLWYGIGLMEVGYLPEALEQITIAQHADPVSGLHNEWMARILFASGKPEEAQRYARRALELGRVYAGHVELLILFGEGDYDGAVALVNDYPDHFGAQVELVPMVVSALEDPGQMSLLKEAVADAGYFAEGRAWFYARQPEEAFRVLEDLAINSKVAYSYVWLPYMDFLRRDPYFEEFIKKTGFVAMWEERGWPEQCRPVGDSFECD